MGGELDMRGVDRLIAVLAARQHGVVARRQLLSAGVGRRAIEHRIAAARLHPLHRGVYAVGHRVLAEKGRWAAAVLAAGPRAALSHRTAGAALGLRPSASGTVDVSVPSGAGRSRRDGLRIHRVALGEHEVGSIDGIRITSPARTLLDLAAVLPRRQLERALDQAEVLRVFDLDALRAVAATGRSGAAALSRALASHVAGSTSTRSDTEERFLALCRKLAVPAPLVNARIGSMTVDFAWPNRRLVVEVDGARYHAGPRAFEADRSRDAGLRAAGWDVVRFSWRQLTDRESEVVAALAQVL